MSKNETESGRPPAASPVPVGDLLMGVIEILENLRQRHRGPPGMATGLADLDAVMGGIRLGEMTLVAGRPGSGKTAFILGLLQHLVCKEKVPAAFFGLELTRSESVMRMVLHNARISISKLLLGTIENRELARIINSATLLHKSPLSLGTDEPLDIAEFRDQVRSLVKEQGLRLVVLDYLQLLEARQWVLRGRPGQQRAVAGTLGALARELGIALVVVSQLEAASPARARPRLVDLGDSFAAAEHSGVVLLIHRTSRPDQPAKKDAATGDADAEIIVTGARTGHPIPVPLRFVQETGHFESLSAAQEP